MFTGIVAELGQVQHVSPTSDGLGRWVRIAATEVLADATLGCSIAVNGCCLTAVDFDAAAGWFETDITSETIERTNIGHLAVGDPVNLERPLPANGRFDGHIVLGHVDSVAMIVNPAPQLRVRLPSEMMRYLAEKGSVAVDGVSLTVFNLTDDTFDVAVIPHTAAATTLGVRRVDDGVNIELDILAKHVDRLVNR